MTVPPPAPTEHTEAAVVTFTWQNPEVRSMGHGIAQMTFRIASAQRWLRDIARSGTLSTTWEYLSPDFEPPTIVVTVVLPDANYRFTDVSPPADFGAFEERQWYIDPVASLSVQMAAENVWLRDNLDSLSTSYS
jgi:hypothetical protein